MVTAVEAQAELDRRSSAAPTAAEARAELRRRAATRPLRAVAPLPFRSPVAGSIATNSLNGGHDPAVAAELERRQQWEGNPDLFSNRARVATLAHGGTFGLQDELTGVGGGAIRALQDASGPSLGPGDDLPARLAHGYRSGYQDVANEVRGDIAQYRRERPTEAAGVELAGGVMSPANRLLGPLVSRLPGGAMLTRAAAGKGIPAWLAQTVQGVEGGTIGGGAYGFNTGDGDWAERSDSAQRGASVGAVLGAAAPAVINAVRPVAGAVSRGGHALWEALPIPEPNTVGMSGGNLRLASGGNNSGPRLPGAAVDAIDRLAQRSRMSAADFEQAAAEARANPQGQAVADVFGDAGTRALRPIVQAPGETGTEAQHFVRDRFQRAHGRIIGGLQRGLNVGETRTQAMERLNQEYARASAENYNQTLNQPTTPEMSANLSRDIGETDMALPIMRQARRRAEGIFEVDRANGDAHGEISDSLPRYMHYLKMGLDAAIGAAKRNPTGLQSTELRGVMQLRGRLLQAMDAHIPGYAEARARWGGLANAEEALDTGAEFVGQSPESVQQQFSRMTPFEREHARIGFVDEIRHATRGGVNRSVNVARALDDPELQQTIATLFDNPRQAAQYLEGTVNTQYRLLENASQWRGGSSTFANQSHGDESAMSIIGDTAAAGHVGGPIAAAGRFGHHVLNTVTAGAVERGNNQIGRALLTRIDSSESKVFTDEVARILRQRQSARSRAASASRVAGGAAASLPRRDGNQ